MFQAWVKDQGLDAQRVQAPLRGSTAAGAQLCVTARGRPPAVTVAAVGDLATLEQHRGEWAELAARAIEANVFYEPEMLLPALRDLGPPPGWRVLLIRQAGRLIGLVPLQRQALVRCGPA